MAKRTRRPKRPSNDEFVAFILAYSRGDSEWLHDHPNPDYQKVIAWAEWMEKRGAV